MAGMAWQSTHVAETYKNACSYTATKTFQQLLVGQKQKDQKPWVGHKSMPKHGTET